MRIRNNKLINFILEFSQIMLVFLGVYSALMCTASSLDMIYDGKLCLLLLFAASIVFMDYLQCWRHSARENFTA